MFGTYFVPRQFSVLVRIQADGEIEVAQRDVPLPVDLLFLNPQGTHDLATVHGKSGVRQR